MRRMKLAPMLFLVALMGCSGQGPTTPTPTPQAAEVTPPAPTPPPAPPAPPAPAPVPPAPPAPPAPAPKADDIEVYEATTDRARWPQDQDPVLPATFEVTLNFSTWTMQVGPLHDLPIYGEDRLHPFFKEGTVTVSLSVNGTKGTWVFQNLTSEASGTLRRVR